MEMLADMSADGELTASDETLRVALILVTAARATMFLQHSGTILHGSWLTI